MVDVEKNSKVLSLLSSLEVYENDARGGITFGEIAKRTGLHPFTVRNIVEDIVEYQKFSPIEVVGAGRLSIVVKKRDLNVELLKKNAELFNKVKILEEKVSFLIASKRKRVRG